MIFFIVQIESFTTIEFQQFENLFIFYWKLKLVTGETAGFPSSKTFLNKFSFVRFKDISFSYGVIQHAGFYTFAKDKKIFIPNKSAKEKNERTNSDPKIFHNL